MVSAHGLNGHNVVSHVKEGTELDQGHAPSLHLSMVEEIAESLVTTLRRKNAIPIYVQV